MQEFCLNVILHNLVHLCRVLFSLGERAVFHDGVTERRKKNTFTAKLTLCTASEYFYKRFHSIFDRF